MSDAMTSERFTPKPAVRTKASLLVGLSGPSGSGKTWSALNLATGMQEIAHEPGAAPGPIVLIDTENGRAKHYADQFGFLHVDFKPPFGSEDYLAALNAVAALGPSVIILDTLTHEHDGEGGYLDTYQAELERLAEDDVLPQHHLALAAWRKPKAARRALISRLLKLDAHLICCFRASERTRPAKEGSAETMELGFTPIAGQEFIYEMALAALLRPGAQGVPTWVSDKPGEAMAIKLPRPFERLFREGEALSPAHGRALALWARGPATVQPKAPHRRQRRSATGSVRNGGLLNGTAMPEIVP